MDAPLSDPIRDTRIDAVPNQLLPPGALLLGAARPPAGHDLAVFRTHKKPLIQNRDGPLTEVSGARETQEFRPPTR
jgi:hypothetical protein